MSETLESDYDICSVLTRNWNTRIKSNWPLQWYFIDKMVIYVFTLMDLNGELWNFFPKKIFIKVKKKNTCSCFSTLLTLFKVKFDVKKVTKVNMISSYMGPTSDSIRHTTYLMWVQVMFLVRRTRNKHLLIKFLQDGGSF